MKAKNIDWFQTLIISRIGAMSDDELSALVRETEKLPTDCHGFFTKQIGKVVGEIAGFELGMRQAHRRPSTGQEE